MRGWLELRAPSRSMPSLVSPEFERRVPTPTRMCLTAGSSLAQRGARACLLVPALLWAGGCASSHVWDEEVGACRDTVDLQVVEADFRGRSGLPALDVPEAAIVGMIADGLGCAVQDVCGWRVVTCGSRSLGGDSVRLRYAGLFDERLALRGTVRVEADRFGAFVCDHPLGSGVNHLVAGELPPCWSTVPYCIDGWPNCGEWP